MCRSDHNYSNEAQISQHLDPFNLKSITTSSYKDLLSNGKEKRNNVPEASPPKNSDSDQKRLMEAIANSSIRTRDQPQPTEQSEVPKRPTRGDTKMILKLKSDVKPPAPPELPQTRISGLNPSSLY